MKLGGVDICSLWESGHMKARSCALECGIVKAGDTIDSLVLIGCTLKKPKGKLIGVNEVESDISIDQDEINDATDGRTADTECTSSNDESDEIPFSDLIHNSTIEVDGKNIYKASVLNSMFSSNALSKDRLKRVQGLTAGTPGTQNSSEDNIIYIGDPLIVHANEKTTVGNIQKIKLGNQIKKHVTYEELQKPNLQFEVKFLDLVEKEGDRLFWNGLFVGDLQKVNADKCVLIQPSICPNPPDSMSNYFFEKQFLLDVGVQFTLTSDHSHYKQQPDKAEVQSM